MENTYHNSSYYHGIGSEFPKSEGSKCVIDGTQYYPPDYPDTQTFYESLQGYALALYIVNGMVVGLLAVEYAILVAYILKNVPSKRQVPTMWVTSVQLVASIMSLFSILTPVASPFVWTFYKGYVGVIMWQFVGITVAWHGGGKRMVNRMKGQNINLRVPPCCIFWCLPNSTPFTLRKLQILKGCVYQVPFVHVWMLFLLIIFSQIKLSVIGNTHPDDPYFYINIILTISFFVGLWAIFALFQIEKTYNMLRVHQYRIKSRLLKVQLILINVQDIVVDIFTTFHWIECSNPDISAKTMGTIIKSILVMAETIVLGSIVFWLYLRSKEHVREGPTPSKASRNLRRNDQQVTLEDYDARNNREIKTDESAVSKL